MAVDPVQFKLDMAKTLGATHVISDPPKAQELVTELTHGQLADHAICTVGVMNATVIQQAFDIVGKGCQVTVTGVGNYEIGVSGFLLPAYQKSIVGTVFGGANPLYDIPKLLELYRSGDLKLDELVTQRYRLDQVNDGYRDMLSGKNVRGVIIHEHS